jgi:large subunit ribosomal protein L21
MYAVIATGGKQYRIQEGDVIKLEKLDQTVNDQVEFTNVLMVSDGESSKIGSPYLDNAKVTAKVLQQGRGAKIKILKFRRRKHSMTRQGHRQDYTQVRIESIKAE